MTNSRLSRGLFVTGTDTGVGKTIVTAGLAAFLRKSGCDVGVMKPAETGCAVVNGDLLPSDAAFLRHMSGAPESLKMIVPYTFREPLAPAVAAELAGVSISIGKLTKHFKEISLRHDFTLVEGAGGLLVPLKGEFLIIDLIKLLKLPVLIVSRVNLGTINHTLLTVRCACEQKVPVAGIVLNTLSPEKSPAVKTNPEVIAALIDVPFWGVLPFQKGLKAHEACEAKITELIERHLDLSFLFKLIKTGKKEKKHK